MDVCCWNLNVCNTEIKPYYNWQVLQDWEGNLVRCVKKPRGECKVNVYESSVIGMIELIDMKWKGQLEWLDDLDALNQLKWPSKLWLTPTEVKDHFSYSMLRSNPGIHSSSIFVWKWTLENFETGILAIVTQAPWLIFWWMDLLMLMMDM